MDEVWEARRVKLQQQAKDAALALLDHMNGAERVKMTVPGRTDATHIVIADEGCGHLQFEQRGISLHPCQCHRRTVRSRNMTKYGDIEISDGMRGTLRVCQPCGKHILVEEKHNGVSHTMAQIVCHWDCLTPEQQAVAKQHYKLEI